MGALSPTHWLIIAGVVVLLFGAKKMPDFARSMGQSMRILKAETSELRAATTGSTDAPSEPTPAGVTAPAHQPAAATPTTAAPSAQTPTQPAGTPPTRS